MQKKRKGFTLIELLAVIVILGLLMAIAIPSITKYITQSRKKTLTTTIGNYIGALANQVNDMEYTFTASDTIYAVPIECIALERGGTDPFGHWLHANDNYWAYVLVQYNDATSSYTYGFTFKDSAGYGLYPTTVDKLRENGSQILTNLDLNRPKTGKITNITSKNNWNGFSLNEDTNLIVLEGASVGDGKSTCTICQDYDGSKIEEENVKLHSLILKNNTSITNNPTLNTSSNNSADTSGLYLSSNYGVENIYYFRGNVKNNYVKFANLIWRVINISSDGKVKIILENGISNNSTYAFNTNRVGLEYMYYSNSDKTRVLLLDWYENKLKEYDSYISSGVFCEQVKVIRDNQLISAGSGATAAVHTNYIPILSCSTDGHGKGVVSSKVGLITYEEVLLAGGYYELANSNYYLKNNHNFWTMSPGGMGFPSLMFEWCVMSDGSIGSCVTNELNTIRPVVVLNADVIATGTGISSDPYVIKTN